MITININNIIKITADCSNFTWPNDEEWIDFMHLGNSFIFNFNINVKKI